MYCNTHFVLSCEMEFVVCFFFLKIMNLLHYTISLEIIMPSNVTGEESILWCNINRSRGVSTNQNFLFVTRLFIRTFCKIMLVPLHRILDPSLCSNQGFPLALEKLPFQAMEFKK